MIEGSGEWGGGREVGGFLGGEMNGLGGLVLHEHLRREKPLWWEEWVGCCERATREAYCRVEGAESRWIGQGGGCGELVTINCLLGARVLGWEVLRWSLSA